MILGKNVAVVLPAYNAARTLEKTYREIPLDIVDQVILVDDCSRDDTVSLARSLGITTVIRHEKNRGYGGNQKTCYDTALAGGADIVIMVHPDYQYTPRLVTAMASIIASGVYPVVLGSRILGKGARKGGMPVYKYIANRMLTLTQNMLMGEKLSEYHTGYRAFSREVLTRINYHVNDESFIFDNQMLAQIFHAGFEIGEVTCPTRYFEEASSINMLNSAIYGLGVLRVSLTYFLQKRGIVHSRLYKPKSNPLPL